MSTIVQKMALFWTSNSGQVRSDMGNVTGSILNVERSLGRAGRQAGYMQSQMRALGTTMKYFISGSLVFGGMNMVRSLSQFQQQLGMISALGGQTAQQGGFGLVGNQLDSLKQQLYGASTELITPLSDVSDAVINYLSTVQRSQGVSREDIIPSIVAIGKAARLSQTPVEDMTKALTTMNIAFGRTPNTKNISDFAAKWFELISKAPGGIAAAPQLVQQMGTLAAGARFAKISPGQMMALTLGTLRFGIPPSQTGQGLAYLMRSLGAATSPGTVKSAAALFSGMGVTTESVQRQGGLWALFKIFEKVKASGVTGNLSEARKRALANINDPNYDPNNITDLGVSGQGINILAGVFRRQHALRTAIALYSMWSSGQLNKDLITLGENVSDVTRQQQDLAEGWKRFADQSQLAQAATALQNMQMQITTAFQPVLNFASRGIRSVAGAARHHPDETRLAAFAAGGLLAALGFNKILGGRIFGRIPGIGGFLGRASPGHAAVLAKAAEDAALAGNLATAVRGSTPLKPVYVTVVDQLIRPSGGPGSQGSPGPPIPNPKKAEEEAVKNAKRFLPYAIGLGRIGLTRVLPGALIGWGLHEAQARLFGTGRQLGPRKGLIWLGGQMYFDPRKEHMGFLQSDPTGTLFTRRGLTHFTARTQFGNEAWAAKQLGVSIQTVKKLEKAAQKEDILKIIGEGNNKLVAAITDNPGDFTLNLTVTQDGKVVSKSKVRIPPEQWAGGKYPGTRGRPKTARRTVPAGTTGHK